jgi:hypothetical protein
MMTDLAMRPEATDRAALRPEATDRAALRPAATDRSAPKLQRQPGLVRASATTTELRLASDLALHFL